MRTQLGYLERIHDHPYRNNLKVPICTYQYFVDLETFNVLV